MQNINEICCICLKKYVYLELLEEPDQDKLTFHEKLTICTPNQNWYDILKICKNCVEQLDVTYKFVKACIESEQTRKELYELSKRPFHCNECNKSYSTEQYYKNHLNKKHKNDSEEIKYDNEDINIEPALYDSTDNEDAKPLKAKVLTKKVRKKFKCDLCHIVFKKKSLYLSHKRLKHSDQKQYKCEICGIGYRCHSSFLVHKRWHNDERPFICTVCGKGFRCLKTLKVHHETHASVRAHKCDVCNKSYKTDSNLRMHKQIVHTNPEDYKYICPKCGKKCATKSNLDAHIKRNHEGPKEFACHICSKKFLFNHEVNTHIRSTHRDERLYACEVCKKEFKSSYGMKKHQKSAHNFGNFKGKLVPEKKHLCPYCPKMFPFNNKLQRHILTHTGEKPFKCQLCDKAFREQSYLKTHLRSEHQLEDS